MLKSRKSQHILVCAAIMGAFQITLLFAASYIKPSSFREASLPQLPVNQVSQAEPFFH